MSFADLENYKFEQLILLYLHAQIWSYWAQSKGVIQTPSVNCENDLDTKFQEKKKILMHLLHTTPMPNCIYYNQALKGELVSQLFQAIHHNTVKYYNCF